MRRGATPRPCQILWKNSAHRSVRGRARRTVRRGPQRRNRTIPNKSQSCPNGLSADHHQKPKRSFHVFLAQQSQQLPRRPAPRRHSTFTAIVTRWLSGEIIFKVGDEITIAGRALVPLATSRSHAPCKIPAPKPAPCCSHIPRPVPAGFSRNSWRGRPGRSMELGRTKCGAGTARKSSVRREGIAPCHATATLDQADQVPCGARIFVRWW